MRLLALALVLSLGCQTKRQCIVIGGAGLAAAAVGGYVTYDARNDDEGPPIIFPLGVLLGGVTVIMSAIQYGALAAED